MTAAAIATMATVDAARTTQAILVSCLQRERCGMSLLEGADTEWTRAHELFDALPQQKAPSRSSQLDTVRGRAGASVAPRLRGVPAAPR